MDPVRTVSGRMAPLDRADVDTDQIIPAQFLKRIERSGFGPFAFHAWRQAGDFILDRPEYQGASILVAGPNFGCGSSREHAPWALQDAGYRAIVAPSFADIFKTNCLKIGLLPVELPEARVRQLMEIAIEDPTAEMTIDLERLELIGHGVQASFEVSFFARDCLLNGWDEVALTLRHDEDITAYEDARPSWLPAVT